MTSSQHIRSAFDRDLEMITSKMLKMGGLVESSIIGAAEAFENQDLELAQNVRKRDKKLMRLKPKSMRTSRASSHYKRPPHQICELFYPS